MTTAIAGAGAKPKSTKLRTPEFRASFPSLFEPKTFPGQDPKTAKHSITMLFPKTTNLKEMQQLALKTATDKFGPKEKWPKGFKWPFRNGDEREDLQGYKGCIFVTATSKLRPGIVGPDATTAILDEAGFYAGCYARATITCYPFDKGGNRGVAFGLQNVQKIRDGESFSGRTTADKDFDSVETSSDDPNSYSDEVDLGM